MTVTIKEILEKYPTEFNIDEVPQPLLNLNVYAPTIDDVETPTHQQTNEGHKYTYHVTGPTLENGTTLTETLTIDNYLGKYTVDERSETGDGVFFDETGEPTSYTGTTE